MTSQVVDHSESEKRLHRALYILKYSRAMTINLMLVSITYALFYFWGIEGLYVVTDDTIKALKAQMASPELARAGYGPGMVIFTAVFSGLSVLAIFVWMYLAITNVWRISLRILAAFFLLSVIAAYGWAGPQLLFSARYLDPVFTALLGFGYAIMVFMVLDMTFAIWGVSRSPDVASFRATLDPKLTTGAWSYVNKLLDLPRTPLHAVRSLGSYALALAGAVLLVSCINYIVSVGMVNNKLGQLIPSCTVQGLAQCVRQSSMWAQDIGIWMALAFVGIFIANIMQSTSKVIGGLSVTDALKHSGGRFILYLRPFHTDAVILPKPRLPLLSRLLSLRPFPVKVEEELFDVADGYRPLVAVGAPSDADRSGGERAYRDYLADSEWQGYVADKLEKADAIVIVASRTDGVKWELTRVLGERTAGKTLFLFDPSAKDPQVWEMLAQFVIPQLVSARLVPADFRFEGQPLGFYFADGGMVEIRNSNWTATSYRTAFSYFLSTRV